MIDPAETPAPLSDESLTLTQMMHIMDVATVLRRERELAERELDADQLRQQLRRQLLESAQVTGERVTPEEVDAAIQHYYENLHTFRGPPAGVDLVLARLYIRRGRLLAAAALVPAIGLLLVWLWLR
jgi:hypothetical protein